MQLSALEGDGAPLRTHLTRLRASTGRLDPRLAASMAPVPPAVAPLWEAFRTLSGTRAPTVEGLAPITCTEIEAWQRLAGVRLTPWEADTLLAVDRSARTAAAQNRKATA